MGMHALVTVERPMHVRRAFGGALRRARGTWRAACGTLCASGRSW